MYKWCIDEIEGEIFLYNKFINSINDSEKMETISLRSEAKFIENKQNKLTTLQTKNKNIFVG